MGYPKGVLSAPKWIRKESVIFVSQTCLKLNAKVGYGIRIKILKKKAKKPRALRCTNEGHGVALEHTLYAHSCNCGGFKSKCFGRNCVQIDDYD